FAAACRRGADCGRAGGGSDRAVGGGPGSGIAGRPGVPSWPASHGSAAANACAANGQSCLPGWVTTAHLMPSALPVAHSEFAAAVWSLVLAATFTTTLRGGDGRVGPLISNRPATP